MDPQKGNKCGCRKEQWEPQRNGLYIQKAPGRVDGISSRAWEPPFGSGKYKILSSPQAYVSVLVVSCYAINYPQT